MTAWVTEAEKLPPTNAIVLPRKVSSRGAYVIISTVEPVGTGETILNSFLTGSRLRSAAHATAQKTAKAAPKCVFISFAFIGNNLSIAMNGTAAENLQDF